MILTGGRFRGRRIATPPGDDVRPTPARVKEALFSILAPRIVESTVLDLYAGSGALGLEALSRGATSACFVEADARTADLIKETIQRFGLSREEATVLPMRVSRAVSRLAAHRNFDIVFADPPYSTEPPIEAFTTLSTLGRLADDALIIYEHAAKAPEFATGPFQVVRRESWGEVGMTFLSLAPVADCGPTPP